MLASTNAVRHSAEFVSAAYAVTAGYVLLADLPAALLNAAANGLGDRCIGLRPLAGGRAARGVRLRFYSDAAEDATATYRLYILQGVVTGPDDRPADFLIDLLGSGTLTVGAATGSAGGVVTDSFRFADTLTWAKSAAGTAIFDAVQAADAQAHSPADDSIAFLHVPDVGGPGFVVVDIDGATEQWGVLTETIT